MIRTHRRLPILIAALAGVCVLVAPLLSVFAAIEGTWMGRLKVPTGELRIVFHIAVGPDGALTAKLDSPDQGATGIPVDEVTFVNGHLHLGLSAIAGSFEGDQKADDGPIDGKWTQGGSSFPLVLEATKDAPQLLRPQEPKPPYPYEAEDVSYLNSKDSVTLGGTITWPRGDSRVPAVLLITGSGPQDRDETVFGHRPFLILADYLTRQGIAVLRVDDRGVGKSSGDRLTSTTESFARDVLAGVDYLKTRKEINSRQIGLIGHSEGGIIAPMVAATSHDVAFIVLMAGTGMTGEEILYSQGEAISRIAGAGDSALAAERRTQEKIFAILRQESDTAAMAAKLRPILLAAMSDSTRSAGVDSSAMAKAVDMQIQQVTSPWFRFFLTYDPRPTLKKVKCPVLAINGEKDLQVPSKLNMPEIESALRAGGNKHLAFEILPGLNHLFQTATTGSPDEYAKIEETMSPTVLKIMGDWILDVTGRRSK